MKFDAESTTDSVGQGRCADENVTSHLDTSHLATTHSELTKDRLALQSMNQLGLSNSAQRSDEYYREQWLLRDDG
jgi:hypothetical protein